VPAGGPARGLPVPQRVAFCARRRPRDALRPSPTRTLDERRPGRRARAPGLRGAGADHRSRRPGGQRRAARAPRSPCPDQEGARRGTRPPHHRRARRAAGRPALASPRRSGRAERARARGRGGLDAPGSDRGAAPSRARPRDRSPLARRDRVDRRLVPRRRRPHTGARPRAAGRRAGRRRLAGAGTEAVGPRVRRGARRAHAPPQRPHRAHRGGARPRTRLPRRRQPRAADADLDHPQRARARAHAGRR
jgi:hypothetical protein